MRESSSKKSGGQAGREGTTLRRAEPVTIITHPLPEHCDLCHAPLPLELATRWERRQVFDAPVTAFDVIEHRTVQLTCHCGRLHTSICTV